MGHPRIINRGLVYLDSLFCTELLHAKLGELSSNLSSNVDVTKLKQLQDKPRHFHHKRCHKLGSMYVCPDAGKLEWEFRLGKGTRDISAGAWPNGSHAFPALSGAHTQAPLQQTSKKERSKTSEQASRQASKAEQAKQAKQARNKETKKQLKTQMVN